eukprot:1157580-Pelagomonas_calceolata.AAC.2
MDFRQGCANDPSISHAIIGLKDPCSCVPDCNNLWVPGVLREVLPVGAGLWIVVAKEMWIGSDEFGIGRAWSTCKLATNDALWKVEASVTAMIWEKHNYVGQ